MKKTIKFGDKIIEPSIRKLSDISDVVYDTKWLDGMLKNSRKGDIDLYYMYRDLALNDLDRKVMQENNLRYDITIIPALEMGTEYVKTLGHYHPPVPGTGVSYPEIYEVLEGSAHYLLQKSGHVAHNDVQGELDVSNEITDVILIEAKKGDTIIIPPNYGHITINPSEDELKMANFVSDKFSSVYREIGEKHGGAYFELVGGKLIKNENYENLPKIRKMKPISENVLGSGSMYYIIREDPGKLEFLNNPQEYTHFFERIL